MTKKRIDKAVAIRYDQAKSTAPSVVASGKGEVAKKIIAAAKEAGVHIEQDQNLVELLSKVEIGKEIPVELYQTIAEVLAFVYRVNENFKKKMSKGPSDPA